MSIRLKIILIVLPLIVAALLLTGVSSYFAASNSISRVAREFLAFKASQLRKHAESQWALLVENGLTGRPEMVEATREAVAAYAASLATSTTDLTVAFSADGSVATAMGDLEPAAGEREEIASLALAKNADYLTVSLGGVARVAKGFWFEPFGWYVLVTEERAAFYAGVNEIWVRTLIILGVAIAAAVALVLVFTGWLTRPLSRVIASMRQIITTNDLGERVEVEYPDEIGQLAQAFNLMVENLEAVTVHVQRYAKESGVSLTMESKVRNVFQMYVPKGVIDQALGNPKTILGGENRVIAVLSSDIRGFTSISEKIGDPADLVNQLNRYFEGMVDIIDRHGGIVEEFVGDAIKALFGAIDRHDDDDLRATLSALEMIEALEEFNRKQVENRHEPWHIGVGVDYGLATVGNMGCEQKVKFAAIGRVGDFAEELEAGTKAYRQPVLISAGAHRKVKDRLPCRLLDYLRQGDHGPAVRIYTVRKSLEGAEREAWEIHNAAMEEYFPNRNFSSAIAQFTQVQKLLPGDFPSGVMLERCRRFQDQAPPPGWDGVRIGETA